MASLRITTLSVALDQCHAISSTLQSPQSLLTTLLFVCFHLQVNGGSVADQAGLMPGDALVKVNSTDVFNLRHKEAQDVIMAAGNSFELSVSRFVL